MKIFEAVSGSGNIEKIKKYLEKGGDVNIQDKEGFTLLHIACIRGYYKIIKLLLEFGADTNIKNNFGNTFLHFGCNLNQYTLIKLLLDYGANPYIKNKLDITPFDRADNDGKRIIKQHELNGRLNDNF